MSRIRSPLNKDALEAAYEEYSAGLRGGIREAIAAYLAALPDEGQVERPELSPKCSDPECEIPAVWMVGGKWYCGAHTRNLAQSLLAALPRGLEEHDVRVLLWAMDHAPWGLEQRDRRVVEAKLRAQLLASQKGG